jgi:hypothetical protein
LAGCRCGWLLTYTAALSKDSRHHAASTSTGFASDFRRTRRHPNQPRNFSALRRYVGRIRSSLQSRCQPIHKLLRPAAFVQRTGKTTSAGLRSVRLRGKRSRLWWRWEDSNLRAPCAPVPLTHGCSCRELQNAITTLPHLHEGGCSSFRAASQSCDGAQALLRQQSFKRSQTHLLEGELNDLAFGHVSMCPQLQHRGLRGLLQDFASPIRLFR